MGVVFRFGWTRQTRKKNVQRSEKLGRDTRLPTRSCQVPPSFVSCGVGSYPCGGAASRPQTCCRKLLLVITGLRLHTYKVKFSSVCELDGGYTSQLEELSPPGFPEISRANSWKLPPNRSCALRRVRSLRHHPYPPHEWELARKRTQRVRKYIQS